MQTVPNPELSIAPTDETSGHSISNLEIGEGSNVVSSEYPDDSDSLALAHRLSAGEPAPHPRVVCYLDRVTPDGYIEGWARDEGEHRPCILQILQDGNLIAETVADCFRQDLLDAGIGHGHYAFYARLHNATPGECDLDVVEKHLGIAVPVTGPAKHTIPGTGSSRKVSVGDLLRRRRWTAEDLVRNVRCLQLAENLRLMGPQRFVDVTYLFLLNRWVDEPGLRYVRQIESGEMTPERFFLELTRFEERETAPSALPGPYDGRFPYKAFTGLSW